MEKSVRAKSVGRTCLGVLVLVVLLVAGCVGKPHESFGGGESLLGTWKAALPGGCQQVLRLGGDGVFRYALRVSQGGLTREHRLSGDFSGGTQINSDGLTTLDFYPKEDFAPGVDHYCQSFSQSTWQALPFESLIAEMGVDPATLAYRLVYPGDSQPILVGSNPGGRDWLMLSRGDQGGLVGKQLDDALYFPQPLYFLGEDDLAAGLTIVSGKAVHAMPNTVFTSSFPVTNGPDITLDQIFLQINAASKITFSADAASDLPSCNYRLFTDILFVQSAWPSPLDYGVSSQTVVFNPLAPQPYLVDYPVTKDGVIQSAWLVPLEIVTAAVSGCSVSITAKPQVEALVEAWILDGRSNPDFLLDDVGEAPRVMMEDPARPGVLMELALGDDAQLPWQGLRLKPWARMGAGLTAAELSPWLDVLRLTGNQGKQTQGVLVPNGAENFLTLFGEANANMGQGPYYPFGADKPFADFDPQAVEDLPSSTGTLAVTLAGDQRGRRFRLSLDTPTRLAFESLGALDTRLTLRDEAGWPLASADIGAASGAGFFVERQLPAGITYVDITATTAGDFTLTWQTAGAPLVVDDALFACLVAAGWNRVDTTLVLRMRCPEAGVANLNGLQAFTGLRNLDLAGNGVADLSPLAGLGQLRLLDMAANPVADLSPLSTLGKLERLSLARTQLDGSMVSVLQGLGALKHLVLRGAQGLSESDLTALRLSLPYTRIVAPDGSVVPP